MKSPDAEPPTILDRAGYELEVEDTFAGPSLDDRLWFPDFMLDIYEFADGPSPPSPPERYPKIFAVEWFRGYRPIVGPEARAPAFQR